MLCTSGLRHAAALAACLMWLASTAQAQLSIPTVSGTVRDESGAALPDVTIVFESAEGTSVTVLSDASGQFRAALPAPGRYVATASFGGFAAVRKDLTIALGASETIDFVFKLAPETESVEVRPRPSNQLVVESLEFDESDTAEFTKWLEALEGRKLRLVLLVSLSEGSSLAVLRPGATSKYRILKLGELSTGALEDLLAGERNARFLGVHRFSETAGAVVVLR
jgi:hypothetical protein